MRQIHIQHNEAPEGQRFESVCPQHLLLHPNTPLPPAHTHTHTHTRTHTLPSLSLSLAPALSVFVVLCRQVNNNPQLEKRRGQRRPPKQSVTERAGRRRGSGGRGGRSPPRAFSLGELQTSGIVCFSTRTQDPGTRGAAAVCVRRRAPGGGDTSLRRRRRRRPGPIARAFVRIRTEIILRVMECTCKGSRAARIASLWFPVLTLARGGRRMATFFRPRPLPSKAQTNERAAATTYS